MKSTLPDGRMVVQLSTLDLPPDKIIGLRVFHPMAQDRRGPNWFQEEDDDGDPVGTPEPYYDEGIVVSVTYFDKERDEPRAKFKIVDTPEGANVTLRYTLQNLWVLETDVPPLWDNDSIQFPRLLAEINMLFPGLTDRQYDALSESTDLTRGEINDLFDRAHKAWDAAKAAHCPIPAVTLPKEGYS